MICEEYPYLQEQIQEMLDDGWEWGTVIEKDGRRLRGLCKFKEDGTVDAKSLFQIEECE